MLNAQTGVPLACIERSLVVTTTSVNRHVVAFDRFDCNCDMHKQINQELSVQCTLTCNLQTTSQGPTSYLASHQKAICKHLKSDKISLNRFVSASFRFSIEYTLCEKFH